jgi:hypothetical protein
MKSFLYYLHQHAVQLSESESKFGRNTSLPSPGLKNMTNNLTYAGVLLGLFYNPDNGSNMFLQNAG